jgi:CSLREA domain-containing protein
VTAATGSSDPAPTSSSKASARHSRPAFPSARLRFLLVALLLPSLLGSAFLTLAPPVAAAAFTFTVNSTDDAVDATPGDTLCATAGAVCTLRAAIQEANALAAADGTNTITIELAAGQTYTLTLGGVNDDASAMGDLDIKANVTINGHGATVVGNGPEVPTKDRVFQVFSGWTVAINNLTVTGGSVDNANGAGILNDDSGAIPQIASQPAAAQLTGSLTLTNVVVDNNQSVLNNPFDPADGGGVYNGFDRTLNVTGSTFSNNQAGNGGGLYNAGTATVTGSTFSANASSCIIFFCSAGVGGGGIANTGALILTGSRVVGNSSAFAGGGVSTGNNLVTRGVVSAQDGTVITAVIADTDIVNNTGALFGGGIANFVFMNGTPDLALATLQVQGGSISSNVASGSAALLTKIAGGGVMSSVASAPISSNIGGSGGGIFNAATATLTNVAVTGNSAAAVGTGEESSGSGGGAFNIGALTIDKSALTGNYVSGAGFGGAIANGVIGRIASIFSPTVSQSGVKPAAAGTTLGLTNVTISGNSAPSGGGALYNIDQSAATLNQATVANNQSGILNVPPPSPSPSASPVPPAVTSVQNSIVAGNNAYNCSGTVGNGGNNIDSGATCAFGTASNSLSGTDPKLGPLTINAPGTTATHAIAADSPARDRVPSSGAGCPATDQRGVTRPQGAGCDSGAFELAVGTHNVTLSITGSGTTNPVPGSYTYEAGTTQPFTATANAGSVFTGWTVDGTFVGFGVPLNLPVTKDRTVVATFAPIPSFCDVTPSTQYYTAIANLSARGIILGGDNPNGPGKCFRPGDEIIRAETAGLIARAFGWDKETHQNPFPDKCDPNNPANCIDNELWNDVASLAFYGVAQGFPTNEFRPYDPVVHGQVVSFVVRSLNYIDGDKPDWNTITVDDPTVYPGVPAGSGHRLDLVTYVTNAGLVPGTAAKTDPYNDPATGYAANASRAFVAQTLWQAYSYYYSINRIP